MRSVAAVLVAAVPVVAMGCAAVPPHSTGRSDTGSRFEGFWASEGYGAQLEITADGSLHKAQVTSISCIEHWRARALARGDGAIAFRRDDRPSIARVFATGAADRLRYRVDGASADIFFRRLPGPLPTCARPTPSTPRTNLDVFAATIAENYPFFALHRVDWDKAVAAARAKVGENTTPRELFDVLVAMITPFEDAHLSIAAPDLEDGFAWAGLRKPPGILLDEAEMDRATALAERYVVGGLRSFCGGAMEAGMLPGDIAYLRVRALAGYEPSGGYAAGLGVLQEALDTVFAGAARWKGLVLDVRVDGGGFDAYAAAIAARLTSAAYATYAIQARRDPRDRTAWTTPQPQRIEPRAPGFDGPLAILIGPNTISAAEVLALDLVGRRPRAERIGQPTQGVFSDVMDRSLPNGWRFGVPNERYVLDGVTYDAVGVPPTIAVPVFAAADVAANRDRAIEEALRVLTSGRTAP